MAQIEPSTGSDLGSTGAAMRFHGTHQVHGCALLLGTRRLLASRYLLKRLLGQGARSVVYLAEDTVAGIDVALKVFVGARRPGRVELERCVRPELKIARKVVHPNVCRVFDLGQAGDELFLTMEYVAGKTLKQRLATGRLPSKEAHEVVLGVLDALVAIHEAGVVHRDLKPSNVMITPEGDAVVLDFGLAADLSAGPLPEPSPVGTAKYASPEQVRGEPATARSDLYSFGVLAREVYARTYKKAIPRAIEEVLARATAEAPEARVESARELRDALAKVVARRRLLSQIRRSAKSLFSL